MTFFNSNCVPLMENIYQAMVVWRLDNTIQWINLYTVDSELRDVLLSHPLDSDLFVEKCYPPFIQLGLICIATIL